MRYVPTTLIRIATNRYQVTIYKGVFSMKQRIDALRLARILFNYRDGLTDITGQFDQKRANMVQSLFSETNNLPSLSSVKRNSTKNTPKGSQKKAQKSGQGSKGKSNLPPVPEEVSVEILLRSLQVKSLFEIDDTFLQVTQVRGFSSLSYIVLKAFFRTNTLRRSRCLPRRSASLAS